MTSHIFASIADSYLKGKNGSSKESLVTGFKFESGEVTRAIAWLEQIELIWGYKVASAMRYVPTSAGLSVLQNPEEFASKALFTDISEINSNESLFLLSKRKQKDEKNSGPPENLNRYLLPFESREFVSRLKELIHARNK